MPATLTSFSRRLLLCGIVGCALLQFTSVRTRRITPSHSALPAQVEGNFTEGSGWYAGEPFRNAIGVRAWGSWTGHDDNEGMLVLGPFPAPRMLRVGISGYPGNPGNQLYVELAEAAGGERHLTKDTRRVVTTAAVGERWDVVDCELPVEWRGRPIRLVAIDHAKGPGGWLGVTEPVRGGRSDGINGFIESLAAWSINGLLLGLVFLAGVRLLASRDLLPPQWVALGAGGIVAFCGYATFWMYFLNPLAGVILSWVIIAAALVAAVYGRRDGDGGHRPPLQEYHADALAEALTVAKITFAVGLYYLALLHLYPSPHDFHTLAANRYAEALPGDNVLSHVVGERLFAGQPPKNAADEWRSSDRPPLQAGWQLLTWSAAKVLSFDRRVDSGTSAMWFQLLWIAGAYGLLRSVGVSRARTLGWIVACAGTGFFTLNTVFTWPKLSAAAFASGAFALWVFGSRPANESASATPARTRVIAGGIFAALAWLSHGGVAFSFLALVPWLAWRAARGHRRAWLGAAAVFALIVLPWLAYQKFYDPPGDRLLKWHLAGQTMRDDRTAWQALREAYTTTPWRDMWANRVTNFHAQVLGDWWRLFELSDETRSDRRYQEFFFPLRALTWWPLLALTALVITRRRIFTGDGGALLTIGGWCILTVVIWCLALFNQYQAVVHQGSYALMLALFVWFSVVLERSASLWLPVIVVLEAITFWANWGIGNNLVHGPMTGLPLVILTALPLVWFVGRACVGPVLVAGPSSDDREVHRGLPTSGSPTRGWRESIREWWQNPRLNAWVVAAIALLMFLRKPHTLHTPQLWAEDGSIFLDDQDEFGSAAFIRPYMGYLHLLPRLIAWAAAHVFDPAWWPAIYNGVSFAIWVAVVARLFTQRFPLPAKPWLALAFLLVPHTGEVFFNATNLQWITAFVLIQQALIQAPLTRGERIADAIILLLVSLTGPFVVAFLPLFIWRWWRERRRDNLVALAVVGGCALVQIVFVARTAPNFAFQSAAFHFWPAFEVLARRVVLWPVLGSERALAFAPVAIRCIGALFLGAVAIWTLRPSPRRMLRAQILAAFVLIVIAGVYRTRPDTWASDNLNFGDRYFYIPRVLLGWLLIWEFDVVPLLVANVARLLCLATVFLHVSQYSLPAPTNYHWAEHVEPIRRGVPANIPILPENWTLEYRGRTK